MEAKQKKESPIKNILFNIIIPSIILFKFSGDEYLGPRNGLIIALAFPFTYFFYDLLKNKKTNFISILGFVSLFLTGVIGLFELDKNLIAIKEASIPLVIGAAIAISMKTKFPLVEKLLYNDQILNKDDIERKLREHNNYEKFRNRLRSTSWILASSFLLSAVLNYALAKYLIVSEAGTEAFNEELAKMNALSFPVIALPSTFVTMGALFYLVRGITDLTGLKFEEIIKGAHEEKDTEEK